MNKSFSQDAFESQFDNDPQQHTKHLQGDPRCSKLPPNTYENPRKLIQLNLSKFIDLVQEEYKRATAVDSRNLWNKFTIFKQFIRTQLDSYGSDDLLEVILISLMISRLPPNLPHRVIRKRHETDDATASSTHEVGRLPRPSQRLDSG